MCLLISGGLWVVEIVWQGQQKGRIRMRGLPLSSQVAGSILENSQKQLSIIWERGVSGNWCLVVRKALVWQFGCTKESVILFCSHRLMKPGTCWLYKVIGLWLEHFLSYINYDLHFFHLMWVLYIFWKCKMKTFQHGVIQTALEIKVHIQYLKERGFVNYI